MPPGQQRLRGAPSKNCRESISRMRPAGRHTTAKAPLGLPVCPWNGKGAPTKVKRLVGMRRRRASIPIPKPTPEVLVVPGGGGPLSAEGVSQRGDARACVGHERDAAGKVPPDLLGVDVEVDGRHPRVGLGQPETVTPLASWSRRPLCLRVGAGRTMVGSCAVGVEPSSMRSSRVESSPRRRCWTPSRSSARMCRGGDR